jgi:hypothetical protein
MKDFWPFVQPAAAPAIAVTLEYRTPPPRPAPISATPARAGSRAACIILPRREGAGP